MTKKKRLFSMFAVMLIAIFSVGCVFAAACGKKDEEETTPQHTHNYVVTDSKDATCGEDGYITYTCEEDGDTYTETVKATGNHTWDEGVVTQEPTCVEGEKTFTCTVCGATTTDPVAATAEHTFSITDADDDIEWDWATDYSSATATVTCAVCENPVTLEAEVSSSTEDTGTTYTATVKIGETEYTTTKFVELGGTGSEEEAEIAVTVDAKTMAFTTAGAAGTANASYTVDGDAYSGDEYTASVSSSDESVATVALVGGTITVTSVANGSAYVTYSVSDAAGEVLASGEIYVVIDTAFVAYEETTGVYNMQYMAVKGETGGAFVAFGENANGVTISDGCTTWGNNEKDGAGRSKSTTDSSFTWTDYAEIRNDDGKYITIEVPEGYTADVTAYMSHTNSSSNRTAYIDDSAENAGNYIASVTVGNSTTDGKTRDNLHAMTAESLGAGSYVICTENDTEDTAVTMHCYAVFVTYEAETEVTHQHTVDTDNINWSWSDDYTSVTATFTCTTDGCDWESNTCTVSSENGEINITDTEITAATCGATGSKTYTATIENTQFSDTTDPVEIPATGNHTYETKYLTTQTGDAGEYGWCLVCSVCGDVADLVEGTTYDFSVTTADELGAALGINGAVITLQENVEGAFTVTGSGINLDLNGHSITYTYADEDNTDDGAEVEGPLDTITVAAGAGITIEDNGGNETNAVIKNTYTNGTSDNNAAAIFTEGTLVINGGTVESSSVGIRAQGGTVTITGAKVSSDYFTIWTDAGEVTVTINEGSVIEGKRKGIFLGGDNGNFGITPDKVAGNAKSTLIINDGTITCENESAISTLGKCNSSSVVIVIYDGEIEGTSQLPANTVTGAAPAVYIPSGTLYVLGGTITGTTAVEVRGGSTTICGGTLISTADPLNEEQQAQNTGHGATTYGYSLAVFPYGQGVTVDGKEGYAGNEVTVIVSGGTFIGAVYAVDEETWSGETGGSYTWVGYTFTISGGTFADTTGLEDFLENGYGFNSWCNGYSEVTEDGTITRVYDFMNQTWTSDLVKAEDGTISVDDIISMKGTEDAFAFGAYGLVTGMQSASGNYYVAMDLSAYAGASSVSVSIQFGSSNGSGDSNVIFLSGAQIPYGQWSASSGRASGIGKISESVYNYGSIPAVLGYEVDFTELTDSMLYLEWAAGTTYIYSITITVATGA
ncbi:MAG: carbohydrate-binding domain-containing protein [Bacteroidales bacterium]|nr:carbohydrate-binding domain-containing protein [Bacteroidales bacterium]